VKKPRENLKQARVLPEQRCIDGDGHRNDDELHIARRVARDV
jgi:hypothetical protein